METGAQGALARRPEKGAADQAVLTKALDLVVRRMDPDQVILFGSAARGEMHEASDLDLLVLTHGEPDPKEARQHRWAVGNGGGYLHVWPMTRENAETGRLIAGDFRQTALEDGVTLYTRTGTTPLMTGRESPEAQAMIRRSLLSPEHSSFFMRQAKKHRKSANTVDPDYGPSWQCEHAARCLEYCYKALLTSLGRRVKHTHDLNVLQDSCTQAGAQQPATTEAALLKTVTEHNRDYPYDGIPPETVAQKTLDQILPLVNDVYRHAERRVPEFAEATRRRIADDGPETEQKKPPPLGRR